MSSHPDEQNELPPDGTTIRLELDLEEDIEREIHHFAKLSRMGLYSAAQTFFDKTLRKYDCLPPVIAEYADMLLEQGRYGHAARYLENRLELLKDRLDVYNKQLLGLMYSLATIQTKGALRAGLVEAHNAWELLGGHISSSDKPPDEIHIFELYVNIVVIGYRTSDWVTERWMRCPFVDPTAQARNGFVQWFIILRGLGLLWEASRIIRPLISIMSTLPGSDLAELVHTPLTPSVQLSTPNRWASLVITLNQARFLLDLALRAKVLDRESPRVVDIYRMARGKLDVADGIWKTLPAEQGVRPLYLPLALENACFDMANRQLRPKPEGLSFTLLGLLSEAEIRHDLQSQILARLCILLHISEQERDWRDLYSIFEMQTADCESIIQLADTWETFVSWFSNPESPLRRPSQHPFLAFDRSALLLYHCTQSPPEEKMWKDLLISRRPFFRPIELHRSDELLFTCQTPYTLDFDIPVYVTSFKRFPMSQVIHMLYIQVPIPFFPTTNSRVTELQRLVHHIDFYGKLTSTDGQKPLSQIEGLGLDTSTALLGIKWVKLKEMETSIWQRLSARDRLPYQDLLTFLRTIRALGCFYTSQGWLKEAVALYDYTLSHLPTLTKLDVMNTLLRDHILALEFANDLGRLYYMQGMLEKARQPLVHALEGKRRTLSVDHPSTLNTMNNLGELYQEQGLLKEAEGVLEQAIANTRRGLAPEHPSALRTMKILSQVYRHQGKHSEANELHGRVAAGPEQEPPDSPDQPKSLIEQKGLRISRKKSKEKSSRER